MAKIRTGTVECPQDGIFEWRDIKRCCGKSNFGKIDEINPLNLIIIKKGEEVVLMARCPKCQRLFSIDE